MNQEEVKSIIISKKQRDDFEVNVDDLEVEFKLDRNFIMHVMKDLQDDGVGKFIPGRRGGKSRFKFGVNCQKEFEPRVKALADALRKLIDTKKSQGNNVEIVMNVEDLSSKFAPKDIVDAFAILQDEKIGSYVVGRKGAKSRFVVGLDKKANTPSSSRRHAGSEYDLPPPEFGPFSNSFDTDTTCDNVATDSTGGGYKLLVSEKSVFLMSNRAGGFSTVAEAIEKCNGLKTDDVTALSNKLCMFGYAMLSK